MRDGVGAAMSVKNLNGPSDLDLPAADFDMVHADEIRWTVDPADYGDVFTGESAADIVEALRLGRTRGEMVSVAINLIAERDREIKRLQQQNAHLREQLRAGRGTA